MSHCDVSLASLPLMHSPTVGHSQTITPHHFPRTFVPVANTSPPFVKAKTGENYATREEWLALQAHIQEGFAQGRIKGDWEKIEFRLVPIKMAALAIKSDVGDTFVIVASCPNQVGSPRH
jgi:hypothetical protein